MDGNRTSSDRTRFALLVIILAAAFTALAFYISFRIELNLGIILLLEGVLVGGLGAFLARPNPLDAKNPRNQSFAYFSRPNELSEKRFAYDLEHSAPRYGFENILTFSGLIAIVLGALALLFKVSPF